MLYENVWSCRNVIHILLTFVHKDPICDVSVGSENGLAPNRRQAIILTNGHLIDWYTRVARPRWVGKMMFK